jgi:cell wall-associated NlpC family hydrolase
MKFTVPLIAILSAALLSCVDKEDKPQPKPIGIEAATDKADDAKREEILAYAKTYMGTSYCFAGSDPAKGFDCSGFVNYVFKHFDIDLPRSSSGFKNIGKALKPQDFKVGDVLVFYGHKDTNSIGHVGIISEANGMKSKFIHASSGKEMAVTISELGSEGYTRRFYKCINVIEGI